MIKIIITIIIIIIIIIITLCMIYYYFKSLIAKNIVLNILNNFKKGNIIMVGENKKELIKKINDKDSPINYVYINNEKAFFDNVYSKSDLGLGESYMRNEWYTENLLGFLTALVLNMYNPSISHIYTFQAKTTGDDITSDKKNVQHHYDVGNDFYLKFLTDDLSAYSCGFWFNKNDTLNDAQYNKVNTIIYKMSPAPGKKILDIGCGWGKIANYVANQTKCHVTGITISDEQAKYALQNYDQSKVRILNMDYRMLDEQFDYIYSIGMFEHIRYENYDAFFQMIKRCLSTKNTKGRFVLHTIISFTTTDPNYVRKSFISEHIFPGAQLPNNDWITDAILRNGLNIIHFEGYGGQHYAKTLGVWRKNMLKEKDYIIKNYNEELLKKYEFYFAICEACFSVGSMGIGHYVIVNEELVSTNNSFNYVC